jgi:hypothetical protein
LAESEDDSLLWGPWYGLGWIDPVDYKSRIIPKPVQLYSQWLQHPAGMIILNFPVHSAYGSAITPNRSLLSTPPGYLPNRSRNRLPDFPRLPADRKPGVDGIESPDYDQNHLMVPC